MRDTGPGGPSRARLYSLLLFALLVAALPLVLSNEYYLTVLIFMGVNIILVIGLNLLMGYAGQISLGHAAFFAFGAYGSGILNQRLGLSPWVSMPVSMLLTGLLAYAIGRPILKLKGNYLAMATLGVGLIVEHMLVEWGELTGGPSGLSGVERLTVGGWALYTPGIRYYYVVWFVVICTVLLAHNLVDSRTGRALRAIHGAEIAANTLGVDTAQAKVQVFVARAALAALAGGLYVHYLGFIAPASCGFKYSIQLVTMVVIGGLATIWGSVLGAGILTLLPQVLLFLEDYDILVYGLMLILIVLFMPEGITRGGRMLTGRVLEKIAATRER